MESDGDKCQYPLELSYSNALKTTVEEPWEVALGVYNLLITLIGVFANFLILLYFAKKKQKELPTILFIFLCVTDLITSLTSGSFQTLLSFRILDLSDLYQYHFRSFQVLSLFYNIQVRFSMFLFTVMSVTRCVQLLRPFVRIREQHVLVSLFVSLVTLFLMFVCPIIFCETDLKYHFIPYARIGRIELSVDQGVSATLSVVTAITYDVLTTLVPIVLISVSCILVAVELVAKRSAGPLSLQDKRLAKDKRNGALTILILSTTTLVCFLPSNMFLLNFYTTMAGGYGWMDELFDPDDVNPAAIRLAYFLTTGLSLANSSVNPLVFAVRCQPIRHFYGRILVARSSVNAQSAIALTATGGTERVMVSTRASNNYQNLT